MGANWPPSGGVEYCLGSSIIKTAPPKKIGLPGALSTGSHEPGLALRLGYRDFSPLAGVLSCTSAHPLTALSPLALTLSRSCWYSDRSLSSARWLVVTPRWVHFKWPQPITDSDSRFSWWCGHSR
jgi:hypothetical protein